MKIPVPGQRFSVEQQKRTGAGTWLGAGGCEPPQSLMLPDGGVDEFSFQQSRFANPLIGELPASKEIDGIGVAGLRNHVDSGSSPEDVRVRVVVTGML